MSIHKRAILQTNALIKKFENSTAIVNESRLSIFAPISPSATSSKMHTEFIKNKKRLVIETDLGKTVIKGSILTQTHRDILDCLLAEAKDIIETPRGGVQVVISPDGLLKGYKGNSNEDIQWIKNIIDEVQVAAIEIHSQDGMNLFSFNIISSFAYSEERGLFIVEFSPEYCRFFNEQFTVNYSKELPALLSVKSPIVKAVVRFFWSHSKPTSVHIDELLEIIGRYKKGSREGLIAKNKLISYIWDISEFGITYNISTSEFSYLKCAFKNSISFIKPNNTHIPSLLGTRKNVSDSDKSDIIVEAEVVEAVLIPVFGPSSINKVDKKQDVTVTKTRAERDAERVNNLPSEF